MSDCSSWTVQTSLISFSFTKSYLPSCQRLKSQWNWLYMGRAQASFIPHSFTKSHLLYVKEALNKNQWIWWHWSDHATFSWCKWFTGECIYILLVPVIHKGMHLHIHITPWALVATNSSTHWSSFLQLPTESAKVVGFLVGSKWACNFA